MGANPAEGDRTRRLDRGLQAYAQYRDAKTGGVGVAIFDTAEHLPGATVRFDRQFVANQ